MLFFSAGMAQGQEMRSTGNMDAVQNQNWRSGNLNISGRVVDDKGEPVVGASVVVKGTTTGVTTGINGDYDISAPSDGTLTFSFLGMGALDVAVNGRARLDVRLAESDQEIQEVVVTAMGLSRDKKAIGYAASTFKGDEIAAAKVVNPMQGLQGKVAGVDVTSSQNPGGSQNVTIRGYSSFSSNQPLYIVDGVPLTNTASAAGSSLNYNVDFGSGLNAINPDNIESMTVLKGAAATALYGSRAANGVVMINTKSGKNTGSKIQVTYDGSVNLSQVGRLPTEQKLFGQGWSGQRELPENGNWGSRYDGKDRVWGWIVDNSQQIKPYKYVENRVRDVYDIGVGYKNALAVSGGNDATLYHFALSQNKVDGAIPTDADSYTRYTISANGSHKGKRLTLSSSVNVSSENTKSVPEGQGASFFRSLYEIPNDISIVDLKDYKSKWNNTDNYFTPYGINPYWVINENGAQMHKYKFFGKFQADLELHKTFKLTYRFGGDYESMREDTHLAVVAFGSDSPNAAVSTNAENPGEYRQLRRQRLQLNHDAFATYSSRFAQQFQVDVIAGFNANERSSDALQGLASSIDVADFYHLANTLATPVASQSASNRAIVGAYINADFGFRDYAYLTLTARNDWSSTLPKNANSFFYPGATASVVITEVLKREFNLSTGVLNYAKLRAAYGQTGNDADPYYVYNRYVKGFADLEAYPSIDDISFPLGGLNAYKLSTTMGNLELKPEITSEFEVGGEVAFFGNRFALDAAYYNKFTKGLIQALPADPTTGFTSRMTNLGDVRNHGVELGVTLVPLRIGGFEWNVSYNFSKNYNKVERLDIEEIFIDGYSGVGIYAVEGMPIGQFKTNVTMKTPDGNIVVDTKGLPRYTADMEYFGKDINEKFRMGGSTRLSYKGVSVGATLDFRYGGYMYSYTKDYQGWTGNGDWTVMNDRNPFVIPGSVVEIGDGTFRENTVPVNADELHTFYSNGALDYTPYFVIDRSYLKLRDVSISYDLPRKVCERMRLAGLRISANASNILLWTPQDNRFIDPETTTFGSDLGAKFGEFGTNPSYIYYTFGLNFTF
jgi:TonB-linked SusC/RagA family outer membrane protein